VERGAHGKVSSHLLGLHSDWSSIFTLYWCLSLRKHSGERLSCRLAVFHSLDCSNLCPSACHRVFGGSRLVQKEKQEVAKISQELMVDLAAIALETTSKPSPSERAIAWGREKEK